MIKKIILFMLLLMLITLPFTSEASLFSRSAFLTSAQNVNLEQVAEEATPAVVLVKGYKEVPFYVITLDGEKQVGTVNRQVTAGTGFFINRDGYLITNNHVVDDADATYTVDTGKKEVKAKIVYQSANPDLAILKISGSNYPFVELGDNNKLDIGSAVVSVGNALGKYVDSISDGHIVGENKRITIDQTFPPKKLSGLIATSAKQYPGDSGGPLLDTTGKVVGVNVAVAKGTNVSYSIPASDVINFIKESGVNV